MDGIGRRDEGDRIPAHRDPHSDEARISSFGVLGNGAGSDAGAGSGAEAKHQQGVAYRLAGSDAGAGSGAEERT